MKGPGSSCSHSFPAVTWPAFISSQSSSHKQSQWGSRQEIHKLSHCSFAHPKHPQSHLYFIAPTQLPALLCGICPWNCSSAPPSILIHSIYLLAYLPGIHISSHFYVSWCCRLKTCVVLGLLGLPSLSMMSCFMATFLDNGNSDPYCCHNLSTTCTMWVFPLHFPSNMFFAFALSAELKCQH